MKFPRWLREPSLEERVAKELYEARVARLSAQSSLEYYAAALDMAEARILRLEQETLDLLDDPKTPHMIGVK